MLFIDDSRTVLIVFLLINLFVMFGAILAVNAMDLPFLNPYLEAIGAPSFLAGCNFAAAGSTIHPATAESVSPFSFNVQVAQFLRFKEKVRELQAKSISF